MTYDEDNSPKMPDDSLITWSYNISSSAKSRTTKHGRLVTYGERNPPIELHEPLTMWWCVVTWQIKSVTYPPWQGLCSWNLASLWLMVRWMHPWIHMSLSPPDYVRSRDKLKTKFSFFRKRIATKLCMALTYGEANPIMKSYNSNHVIARSHVKLKT